VQEIGSVWCLKAWQLHPLGRQAPLLLAATQTTRLYPGTSTGCSRRIQRTLLRQGIRPFLALRHSGISPVNGASLLKSPAPRPKHLPRLPKTSCLPPAKPLEAQGDLRNDCESPDYGGGGVIKATVFGLVHRPRVASRRWRAAGILK